VALDALDWTVLGGEPAPAWSCGVLFQVAAADTRAIDDGRFLLPLNGLYAGGGLAVARLAHLHAGGAAAEDGPIAREIRRSWSWLERDDAVVAEVSYMHAGRTANAGLRPSLFRHEIELPGDRTTPGRESIPLADLTVRFDSRARRFRLRSRRRGVEVMPLVTSGISPEGLATFLLMIGQQDLQPLALFPGFDVEGIRRWPRFRFGRVSCFAAAGSALPRTRRSAPWPGRSNTDACSRSAAGGAGSPSRAACSHTPTPTQALLCGSRIAVAGRAARATPRGVVVDHALTGRDAAGPRRPLGP
jgi:hypothetical protein